MRSRRLEHICCGRKSYADLIETMAASASLIVRLLSEALRMLTMHGARISICERMDNGQHAILLGKGQYCWRWTRGYIESVAGAIALAVATERAVGRIYNVGEPEALTEAEWVRAIGYAAGWEGEIVAVPQGMMLEHLAVQYNWRQSLAVETSRIRAELSYEEKISRDEALRRIVEWERANRPQEIDTKRFDYAAEDLALERVTSWRLYKS